MSIEQLETQLKSAQEEIKRLKTELKVAERIQYYENGRMEAQSKCLHKINECLMEALPYCLGVWREEKKEEESDIQREIRRKRGLTEEERELERKMRLMGTNPQFKILIQPKPWAHAPMTNSGMRKMMNIVHFPYQFSKDEEDLAESVSSDEEDDEPTGGVPNTSGLVKMEQHTTGDGRRYWKRTYKNGAVELSPIPAPKKIEKKDEIEVDYEPEYPDDKESTALWRERG